MAKWYRLTGSNGSLECVGCNKRLVMPEDPPPVCPRCRLGDRSVHVCTTEYPMKPAFDRLDEWEHPNAKVKQKQFAGFGFFVTYECPACRITYTRREP